MHRARASQHKSVSRSGSRPILPVYAAIFLAYGKEQKHKTTFVFLTLQSEDADEGVETEMISPLFMYNWDAL